MSCLNWLLGHRFQSVIRNEHWTFTFGEGAILVAECLWRLIERDRIVLTSLDDGQLFGLPEPVDAIKNVNERLNGTVVDSTTLHEGRLDLQLGFDNGLVLEFLADSTGHEAWSLQAPQIQIIAVGGGGISVYRNGASEPDDRSSNANTSK